MIQTKKVYEDDENKVIFFNLSKYMTSFRASVMKQDKRSEYYISREISIHQLWEDGSEQVLEILREHPKVNCLFKMTIKKASYEFTKYSFLRSELKITEEEFEEWNYFHIEKIEVQQ